MKWLAWCNGGPNDRVVGSEYDSLGKAIGGLESMMKSLCATVGGVEQIGKNRRLDQVPVKTEKEGGQIISECRGCEHEDLRCAENCDGCPAWPRVAVKLGVPEHE